MCDLGDLGAGWGGGSFWEPINNALSQIAQVFVPTAISAGGAGILPAAGADLVAAPAEDVLGGMAPAVTGATPDVTTGLSQTALETAAEQGGDIAAGVTPTAGLDATAALSALSGASGTGADVGAGVAPGAVGGGAVTPTTAAPLPASGVTPGVAAPGTTGPAGAMGGVGVGEVTPGVPATLAGDIPGAGIGAPSDVAAAGGGGGIGQTLSGLAKAAEPYMKVGALGLGGTGMVMNAVEASQANKIAKEANAARMAAASPAVAYGTTELASAAQGQVTPAQTAQLNTTRAQMKARIDQYLANAGLSDSTTQQDWYNWIDEQIAGMQADMVAQNAQLGISAVGTASAAAPAGTSPQTYETALTSAQQTLAQLALAT